MPVPIAYLMVVIIWSTTPLAINWSIDGVNPLAAAALRMGLSGIIGYLCTLLWGVRIPWHRAAVKSYLAAALGIFGAMSMVYWSALYLPSGMISVFFGLSPIVAALLAQRLGIERPFSLMRWLAFLLALGGLVRVFSHELSVGWDGAFGMLILLGAVVLFSVSGVLVKYVNANLNAMTQTVGSLIVSAPFYLCAVVMLSLFEPVQIQPTERALAALVYLALCGSLIGFLCYFYVLRHLSASTVALVTLMTPVFALLLGAYLNNEVVAGSTVVGAGLIGAGLILYYWGDLLWTRYGFSSKRNVVKSEIREDQITDDVIP